jgi:hypothetical protein
MLAGTVEHALILTRIHRPAEIYLVRGTEVGDPPTTAASEVDTAANLVAIGLVLLFVAAIVWAVTGGPNVDMLPFVVGLPLDLGLLIAAAGLVCLAGGVVMLLRAD